MFSIIPLKSKLYYDDSDVYRALEAIAYSLKNHPDIELEKKAYERLVNVPADFMT